MSEDAATATPEAGSGGGVDLARHAPMAGLVVLYFVTVLGGMALADEAAAADLAAFKDPQNVGNVGVFAAEVLVFTAIFVLAERYGVGKQLIRLVLLAVFGIALSWLVVAAGYGTHAGGFPTSPLAAGVAVATVGVLWVYPEWYVINAVAVLAGAALIPSLGLSFGPLPIVVLLVAWAAYDAYAVYVSGHMKELASGAGDMKAPMVYVVPGELDFSMRDDGLDLAPDGEGDDDTSADDGRGDADGHASEDGEDDDPTGGESDGTDGGETPDPTASEADGDGTDGESEDRTPVQILGLGDSIIPGMLAVSAGEFLPAPEVVPALNANLPAIGALAGGLVGMAALMYVVSRFEGAHAGLPPLNAGVLLGYLVGAVAAGVPVTTALGI